MENTKENIQVDYFVIKLYPNVKEFYQALPEKSYFFGAGTFIQKDKNCRSTVLTLNNHVYLIKEIGVNNDFIFDTIQELEKSFLKSEVFRKARQLGQMKYGDFETDLQVEIKLYEYSNEKRIIINPSKKIDLLYSFHFNDNEDGSVRFDYKKFPSLDNVIKADKINKKLNAKLNYLTSQKR